ncbi:MAG: monoamine oxidase, partial [Saprospiraceae bacterium]
TDLGISIAWQNVPYLEGAWPSWDETGQHDNDDYERLLRPFRSRFFIVGDQASTLPGWQEGAMMSAEHVVEHIAGLEEVIYPDHIQAPNTIKVMQGRY